MKPRITLLVMTLATFTAQAQMPILATDINQNQRIINLGYSDISLTQDFDDGRDSEIIDSNIDAKSIEVILSGPSHNKTIPILSVGVSKLSPDMASQLSIAMTFMQALHWKARAKRT